MKLEKCNKCGSGVKVDSCNSIPFFINCNHCHNSWGYASDRDWLEQAWNARQQAIAMVEGWLEKELWYGSRQKQGFKILLRLLQGEETKGGE